MIDWGTGFKMPKEDIIKVGLRFFFFFFFLALESNLTYEKGKQSHQY